MHFPELRARRLRHKTSTRRLLREIDVTVDDLIVPLTVIEGRSLKKELPGLPGTFGYSIDMLAEPLDHLQSFGLRAIYVMAMPERRDDLARGATRKDGLVPRALAQITQRARELTVISELDVASYTPHGHSGLIEKGAIHNDTTLELLGEVATVHAQAGADFVATVSAMDGEVGFVRDSLDEHELEQVGIIAGSVIYDSAYAPAGQARPTEEGARPAIDAGSYRLDPANLREAIREASLDLDEGADAIVVRPAWPHLDVMARLWEEVDAPVLAFTGKGEYQLVKAAAEHGWVDPQRAMLENLIACKRAGATAIISYHALEAAHVLRR